jgi:crossover junction endodeoxyribonuclease RuvC
MRILGIDPGLAIVGLGLLDAPERTVLQPVEWLTITTPAGLPLSERLCEIRSDLTRYLETSTPDVAVIERLFFAKNERTALDVAQARGVIMQTVAEHGIAIVEPTPLQMKQGITGDGSADKTQVLSMLMRELRLAQPPKPDDAADALALAMYGALVWTQETGEWCAEK